MIPGRSTCFTNANTCIFTTALQQVYQAATTSTKTLPSPHCHVTHIIQELQIRIGILLHGVAEADAMQGFLGCECVASHHRWCCYNWWWRCYRCWCWCWWCWCLHVRRWRSMKGIVAGLADRSTICEVTSIVCILIPVKSVKIQDGSPTCQGTPRDYQRYGICGHEMFAATLHSSIKN